MKTLDRRTFLAHLGGFSAALGVASPRQWGATGEASRRAQHGISFDVVVVGAGLFGSAAARHLTTQADGVALVGPGEPADRRTHHGVFASYHDETRLTRTIDPDLVWATLAKRSVARYRDIEDLSGIEFYTESGYMMVTPGGDDTTWFDLPAMRRVAIDLEIELHEFDDAALRHRFPRLAFTPGSVALLQQRDAGRINPRHLVAAQQAVAVAQGATIVRDEVVRLRATPERVELETRGGRSLRANRVLLATGASTNACRLLPHRLATAIRAAMIMLAEVPPDDDLALPSILYRKTDGREPFWGLLLPPIGYPDGRRYVKTMDGYYGRAPLESFDELGAWGRGDGHPEHHETLRQALAEIVPSLEVRSRRFIPCLITDTATHYPYIDMVSERIGIVVGGNGKGAKSSDEIGRLGAEMIRTGNLPTSLPSSLFAARYATV